MTTNGTPERHGRHPRAAARRRQSASGLLGERAAQPYTPAEQELSRLVHRQLEELLQGRCNDVLLLRLYPGSPEPLGIKATTDGLDVGALRVPVVRQLLEEALLFLAADALGGPTAQAVRANGQTVEHQHFPTRFPHIVIEREDVFDGRGGACTQTTWRARRLQNQRLQTQLNRWLDVANLALGVLGPLLRPTGG